MNLPVNQKHFLSFSRKLFLSVISLFLVFAACFMAYQYQREKEYKVELLNIQLQDCNNLLYEKLYDHPQDMTPIITDYLRHNVLKDLRITVVNLEGKVLFDSQEQNTGQLGNHIGREEIQKALHNGIGFDVRRTSETTGVPYFYSATLYKDYIIRSALPYSVSLINNLKADPHYIWFTAIVTLLLMVIFYKFTNKLGTSINQLREFAMRADRNEPIEMAMQSGSQQYLDLFNQMDDASIEQALATSVKNKDTVMENALKSWDSIKDDLGAFVSSETAVVTKGDDGYIARMNTVYEKRAMEFTLIADEDLSKVETISFSPVYTTGEKMAKAGMNTLMGMGVVFAVLIFISWLISMFKYISVFEAKMKAKKNAAAAAPVAAPAAPAPAAAPAPTAAPAEEENLTDDTELVSVITAAIAAYEGKETVDNGLVVRSIKRVSNRNWN